MENLKSNFRLFWNDKKNCSWEIIRPFNWQNCQNECLPIFTKIQCTCFFLFIVAQCNKMSYWHRNYVTNLIYFQFYFQTWTNLWDESNDIGRSKTTAAISWHPQGKGSTGPKVQNFFQNPDYPDSGRFLSWTPDI